MEYIGLGALISAIVIFPIAYILIRKTKKSIWRAEVTKLKDSKPVGWSFPSGNKWLLMDNTLYIWCPTNQLFWHKKPDAFLDISFLINGYLVSQERVDDWVEAALHTEHYNVPEPSELESWLEK